MIQIVLFVHLRKVFIYNLSHYYNNKDFDGTHVFWFKILSCVAVIILSL
jgi:hypothetical protein